MIDMVYFECNGVTIAPYEDYGIILKSFDAPPPDAQVYYVALDGADGSLDMTEWAGEVKYNDRNMTIALLDMNNRYGPMIQTLHGRRWKIWKSDDPDFYYEGRCDSAPAETRRRVTNLTLNFTCSPWKLHKTETKIEKTISSSANIELCAMRKTVIPIVTLTAACTLTWNGESHALTAGTHTPAWLVVTDAGGTLGVSGSGTITLVWRDGVL